MQIVIQSRGFLLTDEMREHVERRVNFALGWAYDHVKKVDVRIADLNGPRGGEDMRCQIQVLVAGIPDVVIQDVEADVYVAIDRAADRAGRTLARRLGKLRAHRRGRSYEDSLLESVSSADALSLSSSSEAVRVF